MSGSSDKTHWFHIFKSMIECGDVAKIGPHGFTVYAVIKAHTNYYTGECFPGIETISQKAGVSQAQVKRELIKLEENGYIVKTKRGRNNNYTLREKLPVGKEGRSAVASWDYVPRLIKHAVEHVKSIHASGDFVGTEIIKIENLNINLQVNLGGGNTQINVESLLADLENSTLPSRTREKLRGNLLSSPQNINSSG